MTGAIHQLHSLGQSIWYDNIERRLLENGELARMISDGDIRGVTSNPSIFNNAIVNSQDYDDELRPLAAAGKSAVEIYEALAIADIQAATDLFRPLYKQSGGSDGFVSLEVSPYLARETEGTCAEALRLWRTVDRPNLMVKIPATEEGLPAIRRSIADGININVTLIFSQERYLQVMDAYLSGLEDRLSQGRPLGQVASVASFFVSRIDSKVDGWLAKVGTARAEALMGKLAIANARQAYQRFKLMFGSDRFSRLREAGACVQRPLWASTSTKNPAYRDVVYVENLIGPDTVNTFPPHTLDAFRDHGLAEPTLERGLDEAGSAFSEFESLGLSFAVAAEELEVEGVKAFADAFSTLLASIDQRSAR